MLLGGLLHRRAFAFLLAVLVVAELFLLAPFSVYAKRADPFVPPQWMTYVQDALEADPHSRVFGLDGKLYPNTAGALGLQDIRALDALYVERYRRYVKTFIAPRIFDRFTGTELPVMFRDNPMFDALSVRAVLSQHDLARGAGLRLIGRDLDTRVYENTNAYPRAWVVHDVHVVGEEDEAFRYLESRAHRKAGAFVVEAFDPRHQAVVERRGKSGDETLDPPHGGTQCRQQALDEARVEHYSGNSVKLRVEAACPGLLVLPDVYFPGWEATVDGRETTIYPTNGAFRGIAVPEGTSRVEFRVQAACIRRRNWARPCRACSVQCRCAGCLVATATSWNGIAHDTRRGRIAVPVYSFRAQTNISPMLTPIFRCRAADGRMRLARSR